MEVKIIFLLFFTTCCFAQDLSEISKSMVQNGDNTTTPSATVNFVEQELKRFSEFQKNIDLKNVNVTVRFTEIRNKQNDTSKQVEKTIAFQPFELKGQTTSGDFPEAVPTEQIDRVLALARRLNLSVVFTREEYDEASDLVRKQVSIDGVDMTWDHGNSSMVIHNIDSKYIMEDFENFVKVLRDYELPVDITKVLFNEAGEQIDEEHSSYQPRKVTIEDSSMPMKMQMAVAEALKRTFAMKTDSDDRMKLMCKYLGIVYPDSRWGAVMGSGKHYLNTDYDWIRLTLDNVTCTVFGKKPPVKVENDDDDDDFEDYDL